MELQVEIEERSNLPHSTQEPAFVQAIQLGEGFFRRQCGANVSEHPVRFGRLLSDRKHDVHLWTKALLEMGASFAKKLHHVRVGE